MLNKNGERELAYIVKIDKIEPHPNADRLDIATVIGWHMIVGKDEFKEGDLAVYFEVDSQLPNTQPFSEMEFLKSKHFKIKVQKIRGIISQGLLVPVNAFGWFYDKTENCVVVNANSPKDKTRTSNYELVYHEGDFLTKTLNITYSDPLDNIRKSSDSDKNRLSNIKGKHKKFFSNVFIKKLMKYEWFRKCILLLFKNTVTKKSWPNWVVKTDEERVQNLLNWETNYANSTGWVATEKIDGSSATFTLRRTGNLIGPKYEYYVCSRNVVFDKPDKKCFYDTNIYQEMSEKYQIEQLLTDFMEAHTDCKFVTLQGEVFGNKVQNRDYSMQDHDLRLFNFITSTEGRWDTVKASRYWTDILPWVPILDTNITLPVDRDNLVKAANGESKIDGLPREGIVFRSKDGKQSFKVVDPEFILKYHNG